MILLDANILIYGQNQNAPEFAGARAWLEPLFLGTEPIGLTWPELWAYLRVTTNTRLPFPVPADDAFQRVRALLAHRRTLLLEPGPRHLEILEEMAIHGQATGPRLSDAVLAAIAIEHGATLASTDRDFSRFQGLRWINPLESPPR